MIFKGGNISSAFSSSGMQLLVFHFEYYCIGNMLFSDNEQLKNLAEAISIETLQTNGIIGKTIKKYGCISFYYIFI